MNPSPKWSLPAQFAVRWGLCYFILCLYPAFPGFRDVHYEPGNPGWKIWNQVVPWVGAHLLHLGHPVGTAVKEGGDQLYDYIWWLCVVVLAVVAATIWSILDRKREEYDKLYEWLRVLCG